MSRDREVGASRAAARADRRIELLDSACRVIAERGIRRMRMEDLAREAGVSVGLAYRYFSGRDALLAGVVEHLAAGADEFARHLIPDERESQPALELALTSELTDDPAAWRTARVWSELYAESLFDVGLRDRLHEALDAWIDEIADLLAACVGRPAAAVRPIAEVLVATTDGVGSWWVLEILDTSKARAVVLAAIAEAITQAAHG